jgi:hypothetical protein
MMFAGDDRPPILSVSGGAPRSARGGGQVHRLAAEWRGM